MLVSSHTISIWTSWSNVPKHFCDAFLVKSEGDMIVFIPSVVSSGVQIPDILKALGTTEEVKLSTGTVYLKRGIVQ